MLCHVALVRTDVSEELSVSISRVTRIDELGTTLAVTSNSCHPDDGGAKLLRNIGSYVLHFLISIILGEGAYNFGARQSKIGEDAQTRRREEHMLNFAEIVIVFTAGYSCLLGHKTEISRESDRPYLGPLRCHGGGGGLE
jgi:hypothetical protein